MMSMAARVPGLKTSGSDDKTVISMATAGNDSVHWKRPPQHSLIGVSMSQQNWAMILMRSHAVKLARARM